MTHERDKRLKLAWAAVGCSVGLLILAQLISRSYETLLGG